VTRVERRQVGEAIPYRGHVIIVRFFGPDLICEVDGEDLSAFYLTAEAARKGGERFVDDVEKAKAATL